MKHQLSREILWWSMSNDDKITIMLYTWPIHCPNTAHISGGPKKASQLLVGHYFKTAFKKSTKLHTTFFQHVFNHYVNFQSKWTANVEMTVALKLGVEKSNIVDTSNIGMYSEWYSAERKKCQVCLWCPIAITITWNTI